eukprot:jgi/Botrbrau1/4464/Bobra.0348s0047.3
MVGDELISDSFEMREIEDGFFYEVEGKWTEVGDVNIDTGANPSAEEEEEGVDSSSRKVVDIVDTFRLGEQPSYDKKAFMGYVKGWLAKVLAALPEDKKAEFKAKSEPGIKYLLKLIKDLQFFIGESAEPDGTLVYAYYKDGATNPTFLFPAYALVEQKC